MRNIIALVLTAGVASPALAASGPFVSLHNTNFVVLLAFILFIGVLVYLKVPGMLGGALDKRAAGIRSDLDEARALREEAQSILAACERRHREVKDQADRIVAAARKDAISAAELAREALQKSVARRLVAAEDQIASARAAALKDVRDKAIVIAIAAARQVLVDQMTAARANALIADAIAQVEARLH